MAWRLVRPRAVYIVAGTGAALGVLALAGKVQDGSHPLASTVFDGITGYLFLSAGVVAHARRPDNRVGLLMVLVGVGWFAEDLIFSQLPVVFTLGLLMHSASTAFVVHLVVAFPTGLLLSRIRRAVVIAGYVVVFGPGSVGVLFADSSTLSPSYPKNLLLITADAPIVHLTTRMLFLGGTVLAVAVLAILVDRWVRATPPMRRVLLPVFVTGIVGAAASSIGSLVNDHGTYAKTGIVIYNVAFCLLPLGFLAGVLRIRIGYTAVDKLISQLGRPLSAEVLRALLARALGDPSLEIGYWQPAPGLFTDLAGHPLVLPAEEARRMATLVGSDPHRIAVLVHDRALAEDRRLLDAVTGVATLALERQRLAAEVATQLTDVRMSRRRIIAAADAERRRVERDLHDGAQQRLVLTAMALREAAERLNDGGDARTVQLLAASVEGLEAAVAELRELARGIHPAVLTDGGLGPAIEMLAHRMPVPVDLALEPMPRMAEPLEVAVFYVVGEALTNIAKHADAGRVTIALRRSDEFLLVEIVDDGVGGATFEAGSGLIGLRDRVSVLSGDISVVSPAGSGTTISVILPVSESDERHP